MSRVPLPSSRTPARAPTTPRSRTPGATASPTPRSRTTSTAATPVRTRTKSTPKAPPKPKAEDLPPPPPLSIKEAIALKRAEAKKAKPVLDFPEHSAPPTNEPVPEEDVYGRQSVKETIERARSTGNLNLATRNLPCIPSILFDIHLGVTPEPLKSVTTEPPYGSDAPPGKKAPWFEAQDLKALKIGNNEIVEIQPELSMFGSLKSIDMHKNKLTSIPDTLGDLSFLSSLDLSYNSLTEIPSAIFSLPELTVLNLSHNALTSLPFNAPFAGSQARSAYPTSNFFTTAVNRAAAPLPRLVTLEVSHNKLRAEDIDNAHFPASVTKVDLSYNPLGIRAPATQQLVRNLGALHALTELRLGNAEIGDDAFPPDLTSSPVFTVLRILELQDTAATLNGVLASLQGLEQKVISEISTEEPPKGTLRVAVGKVIVKEPWEIEADRRQKARAARQMDETGIDWGKPTEVEMKKIVKESWEIEGEQGPMTEGAKRRVRAQAAAAASQTSGEIAKPVAPPKPKEVLKEAWEIEAEQGLLTEGGKRRARAEAALKEQQLKANPPSATAPSFSLSNPEYYDATTKTLTLPPSAPPAKMGHSRAFSLAPTSTFLGASSTTNIALPTPTLPLTIILQQPFADTLKSLTLVNRRMDRCFSLLMEDQPALPNLQELDLEGCNLSEQVAVVRSDTTTRASESLLPLIARLFPSLQALNLSFNALSSGCLTTEALSSLILCTSQRTGLRRLGLRGNRLTELEGLKGIADSFKGHRDVPGWKLEELDLRDNEIGKLPPELGLLPLDVFLVDGNVFRVPARRIWEREGTKGLLSWLRGRIE